MKKLILLTASTIFTIGAFAQQGKNNTENGKDNSQIYCIYKKENGKMCVKTNEQEVTADVSLTNGSNLKPDGTLMKKDGTKKILKEGECVDKNGKVSKTDKKQKKAIIN